MNTINFTNIAVTLIILIVLDMMWFQLSGPTIYVPMFTKINGRSGYMIITSAIISWMLIAGLINLFAQSNLDALILGLLSYGIYNATNLATIREWTLSTFVIDTVWGGIVCLTAYSLLPKLLALSPL
jgi:uncharacterized membrane protein